VTRVAGALRPAGRPRGSRGNAIMFAIIGLVVILSCVLGPAAPLTRSSYTAHHALVFLDIIVFGSSGSPSPLHLLLRSRLSPSPSPA